MHFKVFEGNIDIRSIKRVVEVLEKGGIIIYPTDTIYAMGCDIYNKKAIERLCMLKGTQLKKANFSFICSDLSHLSQYAKSISTPTFRLLKSHLPGPFTFILPASKEVPKIIVAGKKTVGIRIPDHSICQALLKEFGRPLISTTLPQTEETAVYTDPEIIWDTYEKRINAMLDAGPGGFEVSTVVDCTTNNPKIIRQGLGILDV